MYTASRVSTAFGFRRLAAAALVTIALTAAVTSVRAAGDGGGAAPPRSPFEVPRAPVEPAGRAARTVAKAAKPRRASRPVAAAVVAARRPVITEKRAPVALLPRRAARPVAAAPLPLVVFVTDAPDAAGLIPAVTRDARFVYLRLSPRTTLREACETLTAADVRDGMRLEVHGARDAAQPDHYAAAAVTVRGRVDDFILRRKINEACRRITRDHGAAAVRAPAAGPLSALPAAARVAARP